jgi:lipid-A-disaccharide synthase
MFPDRNILLIAGEASGDMLGAALVQQLKQQRNDLKFFALGGEPLQAQGVKIIFPNTSMNIIGWLGVLKNWRVIYKAMRSVREFLHKTPPDLLILIDYPGFNLRIAKMAYGCGVKVLYYVSPQIWAWKYRRIHKIRRYVDHMAVLFAFEEEIYRKENVAVTYVGHPLSYTVKANEPAAQIYQRYQLNPHYPVVALFPGSRQSEIHRLLPVIMSASEKIREKIPGVQFVLPLASTLSLKDIQVYIKDGVKIVKDDTYNLLSICQAAIVKSGTATLEVALSQVPLLIIYKLNFINYWLARWVAQTHQIGLCNIVAKKSIAKEFIQEMVTVENIADETIRLLNDKIYRQNMLLDLRTLHQHMGQNNPLELAELVIKLISKPS